MEPSELTVTKSRTIEKQKSWEKIEFSLKIELEKNDNPEIAKEFAETLIDSWLKKES
jgi:hypothetical protein